MKTVCIYHKNCFDGICAAWVVSKAFPGAEFRAFDYSMDFPFNEYGRNDNIIIVDFSFKRDIMLTIKEQCNSLVVLDHHKTAQRECEGLDFCHFDMNESGASMAWKFYIKPELPLLVRYIKDRDLWLFKEYMSEEINAYIQSYPIDISIYEGLFSKLENPTGFTSALEGGSSILRYKNEMVEMQAKSVMIFNIAGYEVPVANATAMFSEVGNLLCKQFPGAKFSAYYADKPDGIRQWGLRSIGDFDVSEIAKKYGGGGHRNAAGFIQKIGRITGF